MARVVRTTWSVVWRGLLFSVIWGAIVAPFFVLALPRLTETWEASLVKMEIAIDSVVLAAVFAGSWIMALFVDKRTLGSIGLSPTRLPRDFGGGLAIGIAWLAVPLAIVWLAGWTTPVAHGAFPWAGVPLALASIAVNVLVQQLLLTGYLFSMIHAKAGLAAAVLVSGVLFTAYHAPALAGEWLPAANVFLTAILFCLAREVSGAIWLPLGMHAAWNFLLGPVLGLTVSGHSSLGGEWSAFRIGGPDWVTGGGFGVEGSVPVSMTTVVLIAVFVCRLQRGSAQAGAVPSGQA